MPMDSGIRLCSKNTISQNLDQTTSSDPRDSGVYVESTAIPQTKSKRKDILPFFLPTPIPTRKALLPPMIEEELTPEETANLLEEHWKMTDFHSKWVKDGYKDLEYVPYDWVSFYRILREEREVGQGITPKKMRWDVKLRLQRPQHKQPVIPNVIYSFGSSTSVSHPLPIPVIRRECEAFYFH
ncbi:hypothetical protein BCR33DRAFT_807522 [Rhizoclosmatium globosum]|uniref:Uncharacterized protein n=1 Tax=Rhizoclosmatium globosum TaxID=329046 RepID=A0A1Y2CJW4_9FUNG|nr:hypothetical protein BCR33DRAFT_807522 [Rhizoclosmatium globosum]|eukprot:ORY47237.1 hypothetical protein BCR33DRAFT_807522 [Rhizoclosmatium globosum]